MANGVDCECQNHYYINNAELFCFSSEKSCEDIGYPVKSNTKRCFLSKEDCINNGNKFFNKECFINFCPSNTNERDSDGICHCLYFYYLNLETNLYDCLGLNEECEEREYNYKINEKNNALVL